MTRILVENIGNETGRLHDYIEQPSMSLNRPIRPPEDYSLQYTSLTESELRQCIFLDKDLIDIVDNLVVDRIAQSVERGEMRTASQAGLMSAGTSPDEIGALRAGLTKGRDTEEEITV